MADTSTNGTQRANTSGTGETADRWVTLNDAAKITGVPREAIYRDLVIKAKKARRAHFKGSRWRHEVKLSDASRVEAVGSGHGKGWSGPVTEKTLDRLMKALEPQDFSLDIVLTRA